jgi:hypothetical protein
MPLVILKIPLSGNEGTVMTITSAINIKDIFEEVAFLRISNAVCGKLNNTFLLGLI